MPIEEPRIWEWSGRDGHRLVVKFEDGLPLPYEPGAQRWIEPLGIGPFSSLEASFPGVTVEPIFTFETQRHRDVLDEIGANRPDDYEPPDFLSYRFVFVPRQLDPDQVAEELRQWASVELVYRDSPPTDPPGTAGLTGSNPNRSLQGFLDAAPDGIGAALAWDIAGGKGTGVGFVDVEQGWFLGHDEFANHSPIPQQGVSIAKHVNHGTRVLGVVMAEDNDKFGVGVAPDVGSVKVVSQWQAGEPEPSYNTYQAILDAQTVLNAGDVLLLEAQAEIEHGGTTYENMPIEALELVREQIQKCCNDLDVIVVEAAGNGKHDLDTVPDGNGKLVFKVGHADHVDSGAIFVGAANNTVPYERDPDTNYGSRVDCFAWGVGVATTTSSEVFLTSEFTTAFNDTSAAAAIVAGAAISVQGMAKADTGLLLPGKLRDVLRDPGLNTKSKNPATDRIGTMPDLKKIIEDELGLAPDVYIRDHPKDTGSPHVFPLSCSPDVIIRVSKVADPGAEFGEGSGTENNIYLSDTPLAGMPAHIYLRVRNRGKGAATGVRGHVFWTEVATLAMPSMWKFIGTVDLPEVPPGNELTVTDPGLLWTVSSMEGHRCFIVLLDSPWKPAPSTAFLTTLAGFKDFIRSKPAATWRNFNVIYLSLPMLPPPIETPLPPGFRVIPFRIPGADDLPAFFSLWVDAHLPKGTALFIDVPAGLFDGFGVDEDGIEEFDEAGAIRIPLDPGREQLLGTGTFDARSRAQAQLIVKVPTKDLREADALISVWQQFEETEVGRVTWRLMP